MPLADAGLSPTRNSEERELNALINTQTRASERNIPYPRDLENNFSNSDAFTDNGVIFYTTTLIRRYAQRPKVRRLATVLNGTSGIDNCVSL